MRSGSAAHTLTPSGTRGVPQHRWNDAVSQGTDPRAPRHCVRSLDKLGQEAAVQEAGDATRAHGRAHGREHGREHGRAAVAGYRTELGTTVCTALS